jgi:hypothetical protein
MRRDIEFLSTKYICPDSINPHSPETVAVNYTEFLKDYEQIENDGLGGGMNPLGR